MNDMRESSRIQEVWEDEIIRLGDLETMRRGELGGRTSGITNNI
jgi:hypothetical protein